MTEQNLVILKQTSVDKLREGVKDNIEFYESPNPDWAGILGAEYDRQTSVKIAGGNLAECFGAANYAEQTKDDVREGDPARCRGIYNALMNLTPQQAADERVWTYLTHFVFWDYTRARWPLPKQTDKKIKHIKSHFFVGSLRGMARDNAISRLWWMAHVCNRTKDSSLEDALKALLLQEDVRKEIMERSTFCRSEPILNALMKFLLRSFKNIKDANNKKSLHNRENCRHLCKELNRIGGVCVLDSLEQPKLDALVENIIRQKIKIDPEFSGA